MTANQLLIAALSSILQAARPTTFPDTIQIVTEGDTDPLTRPYLVFEAGDQQELHARLHRVTAKMTLHTRADEQADDVAGGWMQAAGDTLAVHIGSLQATLLPHGWRLKKFIATNGEDGESPDRARYYSANFSAWVERI